MCKFVYCVFLFYETFSETVKVLQELSIKFKMDTEGKLNFKGMVGKLE